MAAAAQSSERTIKKGISSPSARRGSRRNPSWLAGTGAMRILSRSAENLDQLSLDIAHEIEAARLELERSA